MHVPAACERWPFVVAAVEQLGATVVEDLGLGVHETSARAWRHVAAGATHHLVLQDDARLCDGFLEHATAAIRARPGDALSFFSRPFGSSARWLCGSWFTSVATCLPAELAVAWAAELAAGRKDVELQAWLASRNLVRWFTNPSLVQHGDVESLIGHRRVTSESFAPSVPPLDWSV